MRMKIECAFGRMKRMWPILARPANTPRRTTLLSEAAAVLHNLTIFDYDDILLREAGVETEPLTLEDAVERMIPRTDIAPNPVPQEWLHMTGKQKRAAATSHLFAIRQLRAIADDDVPRDWAQEQEAERQAAAGSMCRLCMDEEIPAWAPEGWNDAAS